MNGEGIESITRRARMSAPDLDGRIALVTGAAGGIGNPLARAFVEAGMRVAW